MEQKLILIGQIKRQILTIKEDLDALDWDLSRVSELTVQDLTTIEFQLDSAHKGVLYPLGLVYLRECEED